MESKKFPSSVWFEKFTLRDKKSAFRVSEPDQHILKILAKGKSGSVVLREFSFAKKEDMEAHYKTVRSLFE